MSFGEAEKGSSLLSPLIILESLKGRDVNKRRNNTNHLICSRLCDMCLVVWLMPCVSISHGNLPQPSWIEQQQGQLSGMKKRRSQFFSTTPSKAWPVLSTWELLPCLWSIDGYSLSSVRVTTLSGYKVVFYHTVHTCQELSWYCVNVIVLCAPKNLTF